MVGKRGQDQGLKMKLQIEKKINIEGGGGEVGWREGRENSVGICVQTRPGPPHPPPLPSLPGSAGNNTLLTDEKEEEEREREKKCLL